LITVANAANAQNGTKIPKMCVQAELSANRLRHYQFDVDNIVEYTPHMEIVQIVLDEGLLQAADRAARRTRTNRSALVRDALREYLRRLNVQAKEERDRRGYSRKPHARDEALAWETEAAWPRE
jgi:Arc/MetJ-type ribon-helix-helix transcriptional regulator